VKNPFVFNELWPNETADAPTEKKNCEFFAPERSDQAPLQLWFFNSSSAKGTENRWEMSGPGMDQSMSRGKSPGSLIRRAARRCLGTERSGKAISRYCPKESEARIMQEALQPYFIFPVSCTAPAISSHPVRPSKWKEFLSLFRSRITKGA
jgi:hypothetical protein